MLQQKKLMENVLMPFLDVLCVLLSAMIAFQVRYGKWLGIAQDWDQGWLLWMIVCLAVVLEIIFDYYHHFFRRGYFDELIALIVWTCRITEPSVSVRLSLNPSSVGVM